ncbi:DUF4082 domain-containing protein [Solirubrobacter phytolaccae]|uniref:DUF4082 domain-containing protein n=1 Tax=Solirubrobacter phytolaccae TaxID=1404360 RepID=A0A9X3N5Z4_9ACTN|nr:DUF4082 domain-containing protein [Solirubrobacter phytolaccae]MDA0180308.1 DUF4082 domain-containing protein [Solirubrobacter phytolaccae]
MPAPRRLRAHLACLGALLIAVLTLTSAPAANAQTSTLFAPGEGPVGDAVSDAPLEVGVRFRSDTPGYITALRFYRQPGNIGPREGHLWSSTGQLLATTQFPDALTGWQEAPIADPVAITANTIYVASYYASTGRFAFSLTGLNAGVDRPPLHAPPAADGGNGVYKYGSSSVFPTDTWSGTNYWVDAVYSPTKPADTRPPAIQTRTPATNAAGVAADATVKVTFDEPVDPLTVTAGAFVLKDGANAVPASVAYDAPTRTATLTPTGALSLSKTYTATVKGGNAGPADLVGNRFTADDSWDFSTPPQCPCTVFKTTDNQPGNAVQDQPLELGMKFRSKEDGFITALRFYKQPNNTGVHVGNLWSSTGQPLATATFKDETASGWQQVALTNPVAITKDTTYVVSYHSPAGYYPQGTGYFNNVADNAPLYALPNTTPGGNGVYKYGPSAFPDQTWQATNYWVDASFDRTIPPDTTGPTVSASTPANGAAAVARTSFVTAQFDEPIAPASLTTTTFTLRDSGNNAVTATVTYDAQTRTAKLTPAAPLAFDTTYTARVKGASGGVTDVAGNPLAADKTWTFTAAGRSPADGPGGPILLAGSASDPFGRYYAEILRAEGLNEFTTADGPITASMLTGKSVLLLTSPTVTTTEVTVLTNWVAGGGNLIAMRPDKKLAPLLGLTDAGSTLAEGYLKVDTNTASGKGIESQTLQYHGVADRYTLNGASALATLYSNASAATTNPAATLRTVGAAGGEAAAFTFDLARSVVYTRQGNPAWINDKRDGTGWAIPGTRAVDLFYGPKVGDVQPNWVDLDKVDVPQADEQQRLLANLITEMTRDKTPMPRFWYLPRGEKAVMILTGDDHAVGGVVPYFNRLKAMSADSCSVADWECVRASAYVYPETPMTDAQAAAYQAEGFELALHLNTSCQDYTMGSLSTMLATQLGAFTAKWPSLAPPVSNRTHCIIWDGWTDAAKGQLDKGIRFDTNYYYNGPPGWLTKPGLLTGSGFPMRFGDLDGTIIDSYQSMTQVSDESDMPNPWQLHTLLDNALGEKAYYGAFNVIAHTDYGDHVNVNTMVAEAQDRGVPVISAKQMLDWLDGRNGSSFADIAYSGNQLTFSISQNPKARGLQAMLPASSASGPLSKLRRNGQAVSWNTRTIKGQEYVVFNAEGGAYTATYATDTTAPEITALSATADAEGRATVTWKTDEPASSRVEYGRNANLGYEIVNTARETDHKVELTGLAPGTTYYGRVSSIDAAGNSASAPAVPTPFAVPAGALVDTRKGDFAAGTAQNTYSGATADTTDGEVVLRPTVGNDFDAIGLPADWLDSDWGSGGLTTVTDGSMFVNGGVSRTEALFSPGRTIEFVATFAAINEQGVGFGNDFSDYPFAVFTTASNGSPIGLYAQSGSDFQNPDNTITPLPGVSLSRPHRFKIDWQANSVKYYVDGALVATHSITIPGPMRPLASDYRVFGGGVRVDWLRMGTYSTTGTFTSRVMDSGPGASNWQALTSTATVPAGTTLSFQTRSGATPTPDASWSAWANLGAANAVQSPAARYIQYQARLTRTTGDTPTLQRVQIGFASGTDRAPTLGTVNLAPANPKTNQVVTATPTGFSDPDGDPITYHYRWLRNGTVIPGATGATLNLATAGNGDLGDKIRVEVFATDGRGAASDAAVDTETVANTNPTAGTVTVLPAPASTNDVVKAVPAGFADIDGGTLTYRYQWRKNNVAIAGATGRTLDLSIAGNGNLGDRIDVDVTAVDPQNATSPAARGGQNITGSNSTPVPGTVAISPASPKTDQTLTATPSGYRDPDGDTFTYQFQWKRNGAAISGATAATLNLATAGNGDRGDTITVDITATDSKGAKGDEATGTATVVNSAPIAGTIRVKPTSPATNDVLTAAAADFGDADGDAISYQYQWYRNGVAVQGGTGRSLDLSQPGNGDLGDALTVDVTALDGNGGTTPVVHGSTTINGTHSNAVASYGFEEAAGTVIADETGGHDGALLNGVARSNSGKYGRALVFDGEDDIASVPDAPELRLTTGLTMEAWVKPDATSNWRTIIFREAGSLGWSLYANNTADTASAHLALPDGEMIVNGDEELDPNHWTHLAATYDGNIMRLFANGTQIASKAATGSLPDAGGALTFGANNVWGEHFKGLIDEIRIYNRPLSAAELKDDMARPVVAGTPEPPESLRTDQIGEFAKPMEWPIVPVHLALLSNGKVAAWDGFEAALNSEHTWDPWTKQFESVPSGRNLFCAGHITLTDGRLLVVGGHINAYEGLKDTNLFNPVSKTWARGADMSVARWYPTATTLPDGRVLVVSGDNAVLNRQNQPVPLTIASNTLPEIYNPATDTWQELPAAQRWMPLYPFMFVLPNGKVFDAGPDKTTRTLDTTTGQWTTVGESPIDGHSAVMYRPGKILKSGTWSEPEFPGGSVSARAAAIDFTQPTPAWQEVAPMNYKRSYHTLTVLPDGKVLATGGQNGTDGVDETTGILASEIWDPETNTWTVGASSRRPRLYHSSALLLPDGRVLLAGGGAFGNAKNENSGEIYSPPYLFKGPRPQISAAPDEIHYGANFNIDTPDAAGIEKVHLIRMGAVTHNLDMDQRLIPLTSSVQGDGLRITGPANANVAPPGWYMLFVVKNGVPSVSRIMRLDSTTDAVPPSAPSSLTPTTRADGAKLDWPASTDNVGVKEYRVYRSTSSSFTPSAANRIARVPSGTTYTDSGVPAGTYHYRVEAVDAAGNRSSASPRAQVTVAGDTTAPTVSLTAPANGASLAATVAVTATSTDAVGVASVQFMRNGQALGDPDTTAPYAYQWDTTTVGDGRHTLTAVARDASGNTRTSTAVAVEVHNTGLVAAYGFDETTGATATDTVNHNDGTIANATRVVDGRFGRALSFNGTNSVVGVPHAPALNLTAGMTLEAWIKPTTLNSWRSVILKEQVGSLAYALFANTDANVPAGHIFTTAELGAPAPAGLPLSTWAHLTMTWDGATLKTFVDGAQVGSQAAPAPLVTSAGQLRIGGDSVRNGWFNGLIDEVRVYNRALTPAEIGTDMNRPVNP